MTLHEAPAPGDAGVHRALSSPVRQRILARLRTEGAIDAHGLADHLGLHVNTVRTHLGVLEEADLVATQTEARDRPGRPRLLYRATDAGVTAVTTGDTSSGYRFLAQVLASHIAATAADPAQAAEHAGTAWGHTLVERPAPLTTLTSDEAIERIVAMLAEFGFAPELDADGATPRLLLRRCPFLEVAEEHQAVVCSIHLGLMRGALDELGVDVVVRDLLPFVEPGLCVSHLEVEP